MASESDAIAPRSSGRSADIRGGVGTRGSFHRRSRSFERISRGGISAVSLSFNDARDVRKAWIASRSTPEHSTQAADTTLTGAEEIAFAELARRYKTDEVGGLGAYQLPNNRWVRPGRENDSKESLLAMTAVLERVWGHYLITSMAKALPAEAENYLKEVRHSRGKTPYAWKSQTTWNRYRERASAIFKYAEKQRLIPYGSNPFMVGRVREFVEFEQEVPSRRIPPSKQRELLTACDALWANSKRFPHQAALMRDRLVVLFGTSIRTGEMLAIQRDHCSFVTEEGAETVKLFTVNGTSRMMVRVCVPPQETKAGKRTGKGFTRYVAGAAAAEVFRRKINQFDGRPKAYLFGTANGARIRSFRKSAVQVFAAVGLKFGRGRGHYRIHDARHETISALSQSPQFNDAQVKKFSWPAIVRYFAEATREPTQSVGTLAPKALGLSPVVQCPLCEGRNPYVSSLRRHTLRSTVSRRARPSDVDGRQRDAELETPVVLRMKRRLHGASRCACSTENSILSQ